MKRHLLLLPLCMLMCLLSACDKQSSVDRAAGRMLGDARFALTAARDSLQRAEGPEWERLHVKVQFYERKLMEDLKKDKE